MPKIIKIPWKAWYGDEYFRLSFPDEWINSYDYIDWNQVSLPEAGGRVWLDNEQYDRMKLFLKDVTREGVPSDINNYLGVLLACIDYQYNSRMKIQMNTTDAMTILEQMSKILIYLMGRYKL